MNFRSKNSNDEYKNLLHPFIYFVFCLFEINLKYITPINGKFRATVYKNRSTKHIGLFMTREEALLRQAQYCQENQLANPNELFMKVNS